MATAHHHSPTLTLIWQGRAAEMQQCAVTGLSASNDNTRTRATQNISNSNKDITDSSTQDTCQIGPVTRRNRI